MIVSIVELQDELKSCGVQLTLQEIKQILKDLEIEPTIFQRTMTVSEKTGKVIKGVRIPAYYSEEPLIDLFPTLLLQFSRTLKKECGNDSFDFVVKKISQMRKNRQESLREV